MRSGPHPLSSGAFPHDRAVTSHPLSKVSGWVPLLLPSLVGLFTVRLRDCPSSPLWSSGHLPSLLHPFFSFFYSAAFLLFSFFFCFSSLWVRVSLSRGLC
jgi:hypothetical protein